MNDFAGLNKPQSINWNSAARDYGMVSFGNDSMLNVLFYTRSVVNEQKSRDMGKPHHDAVEFVRMQQPGEASTVIERPVQEADKHRFPRQYTLYLNKKEQIPEGTPIELLFPNSPNVADNLKGWGVYTVEQCAAMSQHAIQNINMGGQDYQNRAKSYLENASKGVNFHKQIKELEEMKSKYNVLQQNHNTLQQQFSALMAKLEDPNKNGLSPSWQPNYDAQAERLNSNHPSHEVAQKKKTRATTAKAEEFGSE